MYKRQELINLRHDSLDTFISQGLFEKDKFQLLNIDTKKPKHIVKKNEKANNHSTIANAKRIIFSSVKDTSVRSVSNKPTGIAILSRNNKGIRSPQPQSDLKVPITLKPVTPSLDNIKF